VGKFALDEAIRRRCRIQKTGSRTSFAAAEPPFAGNSGFFPE
jgi:hypothetical protein